MSKAYSATKAKRLWLYVTTVFMMIAVTLILTACDGANSSTWRMSSRLSEKASNGSFSISLGSGSGTRNRTFELTAGELAAIHITSTSAEGMITLVISQDGSTDGTEIEHDISNFESALPADSLSPGRIRFSLSFESVKESETTISWR